MFGIILYFLMFAISTVFAQSGFYLRNMEEVLLNAKRDMPQCLGDVEINYYDAYKNPYLSEIEVPTLRIYSSKRPFFNALVLGEERFDYHGRLYMKMWKQYFQGSFIVTNMRNYSETMSPHYIPPFLPNPPFPVILPGSRGHLRRDDVIVVQEITSSRIVSVNMSSFFLWGGMWYKDEKISIDCVPENLKNMSFANFVD